MRNVSLLNARVGLVASAALALAWATPAAAADLYTEPPPPPAAVAPAPCASLRGGSSSADGAGAGLSALRRGRTLLVRPALLARLLGRPALRRMVWPPLRLPLVGSRRGKQIF